MHKLMIERQEKLREAQRVFINSQGKELEATIIKNAEIVYVKNQIKINNEQAAEKRRLSQLAVKEKEIKEGTYVDPAAGEDNPFSWGKGTKIAEAKQAGIEHDTRNAER